MEKQLTAVEWLIEQLTPSIALQQKYIDELKEQALEIEKQQITDAYKEASANLEDIITEAADDYYNKTFNKS